MGILGLMVCYRGSGSDRIVLAFFFNWLACSLSLFFFFFLQVLEGDAARRSVVLKLKIHFKGYL